MVCHGSPSDGDRHQKTVPRKHVARVRIVYIRFKSRSPQKLPKGIFQGEAPRILGGTFGNKSRTPRTTRESWKRFKKRQGTQAATCSWSSQKSILRDAVMDLSSLDFCAKARAAFSNFSRTFVIDVSRFSRFVSDFSSQDSGRFSLKSYPS